MTVAEDVPVLPSTREDVAGVNLTVKAGETVAVFGPGPIGLVAVNICKALGATKVYLVGTRDV